MSKASGMNDPRNLSLAGGGLIAFITARLDEDERTANGLAMATRTLGGRPDFYGVGGPAADAYWDHFKPHRELADVKAKRAILALYDDPEGYAYHVAMERVVVQLAAAWNDHPDYRAEWKP